MNLTEEMKKMGLTEDAIYQQELSTEHGALIMGNLPDPTCPVKPVMIETLSLDEYKEWMGGDDDTYQSGQPLQAAPLLSAIPAVATRLQELSEDQFQNLKNVTNAYVAGNLNLGDSHKKIIEAAFAPFRVAVYSMNTVVVTPDRPWIISGPGPVVVHVDAVSMRPGGQILVYAPGRMLIEHFIK